MSVIQTDDWVFIDHAPKKQLKDEWDFCDEVRPSDIWNSISPREIDGCLDELYFKLCRELYKKCIDTYINKQKSIPILYIQIEWVLTHNTNGYFWKKWKEAYKYEYQQEDDILIDTGMFLDFETTSNSEQTKYLLKRISEKNFD